MKILITGVAGTGKSTISKALNDKGIFSVDFGDVPNLCTWRNKTTKKDVPNLPITDPTWYDDHERVCDMEKLKEILNQHEDIVITGAVGSSIDHLPLFDKVILLQCRPETFTHRMETRTRPYGKEKAERDDTIQWQKHFDPKLLTYGAIPVSTEGSLEETIERLISKIKQ